MVYVADLKGRTDGVAYEMLRRVNCELPIVLVSMVDGFLFNHDLNRFCEKGYVLVDFLEFGWDWDFSEHWWGVNSGDFQFLNTEEYKKFDNFVKEVPPLLTFKREILKSQLWPTYHSIEYPNFQPEHPIDSKEEYDKRVLSVMNFWGRSSEYRVQFHGDVWKNASVRGYSVCDNPHYLNPFLENESGEKWASFWIPHYCRTDISNILAVNRLSKLSVSLFGAGTKCFRTTGESCVNSLMVMQDSDVAYSYEWEHGVNCLKFSSVQPNMNELNEFLDREDLYEIYVNGVHNANKYRIDKYISDYIVPTIKKYL